MRLWLLKRRAEPDYDEFGGFVVRAADEAQARRIAARRASEQGIWSDPQQTTCKPLEHDGRSGVVLVDFRAG